MPARKSDGIALGRLLAAAREKLQAAGIKEAALEARLVVEHLTETAPVDSLVQPERPVPGQMVEAVYAAIARRIAGEPVHRILGHREFYGLRLRLSPETLEPRPDTETLVDLVLPFVKETAAGTGECRILDLGTGTGAVALALLTQEPRAHALATDISEEALATAAANADMAGVADRFETRKSDWFDNVEGRFHLIVSNPPYVATRDIETLQPEVRNHDPRAALDGGPDGLDAYRAIAGGATAHVEPGGRIAVETGYNQREDVEAIFGNVGFRLLAVARDFGGHDRAVLFAA